ncbi:MAG: DUF3833 domain-containing protein [Pseudomonadales bacterium]|nr:DUF3833 domain-containing protein [Pseudomonadales bacterium]
MTKLFKASKALLLLSGIVLTACSTVSVQDYAGGEPELEMERFFNGDLVAYGVVKDWRGRVIRRFQADIDASWEAGIGTLDEDFLFDDGETDRRVWTLTPAGEGSYRGTAGDVVGVGELQVAGNAVFLDYVLQIPYGSGSINVRVDDRMYLLTPELLLNESTLRKFGLKVGELLLVIARRDALPPSAEAASFSGSQ